MIFKLIRKIMHFMLLMKVGSSHEFDFYLLNNIKYVSKSLIFLMGPNTVLNVENLGRCVGMCKLIRTFHCWVVTKRLILPSESGISGSSRTPFPRRPRNDVCMARFVDGMSHTSIAAGNAPAKEIVARTLKVSETHQSASCNFRHNRATSLGALLTETR